MNRDDILRALGKRIRAAENRALRARFDAARAALDAGLGYAPAHEQAG